MTKKKPLRKKGPTPAGPVVNFMPQGYVQGKISKMKLVAPEDAPAHFPKMDPLCVPGTFFRMEGDVLNSLVTVMPDGVHVAWITCGRCLGTPRSCICKTGMLHTRGIEWIYIRSLLWSDGIVATHGERYTSDHTEVTSRGLYYYAKKREKGLTSNHGLYVPVGQRGNPTKKSLRKKGATGVLTGKKSLGKGRTPEPAGKPADRRTAVPTPTLGQLNQDAASRSDELLDEFTSRSKKKTLKKNGTTNTNNKKSLKKKVK